MHPRPPLTAAALALLAAALLAAPAAAQETHLVAMRDGVHLATEVWLPGGPGPHPALLRRTPYGRTDPSFAAGAQWLASLGYAVVSQDVRGRGGSEGTFVPFFRDGEDGFDTVAWLEDQPWSNGRVGTWGGSAEGIVQLSALAAGAAADCALVSVATGDFYEGLYPGGAWREELGTAWLTGMGAPDTLAAWRAHEVLDDYWDPVRLDAAEAAGIQVPLLLVGGFYDIFAAGTPRTHALLQQAAAADSLLLMGPWTHGGLDAQLQGEISYPAEVRWDLGRDLVLFFDWCLRDAARPDWPPVRYYETRLADDGLQATGAWRTADAWPPPSETVTLHLQPGGGLTAAAPAAHSSHTILPVRPRRPVPSRGGGNLTTPAGPRDQASIDLRDDVLVVQTVPVEEAVTLAGDVRAVIWAASASTDVDVVARLGQVTPSGRVILLADGVQRGRFVQGRDAIRPLTPDVPVAFEIDLGPVAAVLPAGHALRLSLSGTSAPRYEPNPSLAVPLATAPEAIDTILTVYRGADHPSRLEVPVTAGAFALPPPEGGGACDGGFTPGDDGWDPATGCGCAAAAGPGSGMGPAWLVAFLLLAALRTRAAAGCAGATRPGRRRCAPRRVGTGRAAT